MSVPHQRKPHWLKKDVHVGPRYSVVRGLLEDFELHTVCQEARCPNLGECFHQGTATFLLLGECCTRSCRFCAVRHGVPLPPDSKEPHRIAEMVRRLGLEYVVLTSVTRDDLPDGGAGHFAETIRRIKSHPSGMRIEVLVPDFAGERESLRVVLEARPDVLNHNIETVPRLYPEVRPQAAYRRSLELLSRCREMAPDIITKSGLMVGLGETVAEIHSVMEDLLSAGCSILTLGQYLQPTTHNISVAAYIPPEQFERLAAQGLAMGFSDVVAGPYVRSSFRAWESYERASAKRAADKRLHPRHDKDSRSSL